VGGAAALLVAVLTLAEIVAFIIFPPPTSVEGWFKLFHHSPILGLIDFWGLELPMYLMFALVFLAIYFQLRKGNESVMVIAMTLVMIGIAVFFATNNPFSMLSLSNQYAAAVTETHKSTLLAAGEAILANTNQRAIGGFNLGLFLVTIAGLITSSVMLRRDTIRRSIAYIGIMAFGLSLADYLRQALTSSTTTALLVIMPGAILLVVWFVLVGRVLLQLGAQ
jgi:hypothetical protein